MSLLADLLSKIKQPQAKREVVPNLQNIVQSSARKTGRNKIVLLSIILIIFIGAGVGVLLFINSLGQSSSDTIALTPDIAKRPIKSERIPKAKLPASEKSVPTPDKIAAAIKEVIVKNPPSDKKEPVQSSPPAIVNNIVDTKVDAKEKSDTTEVVLDEPSAEYNHDALLYSAREHEMNREHIDALADYKKVLESDTNNITIINTMAVIYLELDMIQESIAYAHRALDINEKYTPALINMGIAHAKSEMARDAEQYFTRALALEPHNQMVLLNLAILNERKNDYENASVHYEELVRIGSIEGLLGLARIYDTQGMTEQAVQYYRRAYTHDSADDKTKVQVRQRIMVLKNKE